MRKGNKRAALTPQLHIYYQNAVVIHTFTNNKEKAAYIGNVV